MLTFTNKNVIWILLFSLFLAKPVFADPPFNTDDPEPIPYYRLQK